MERSIDISVIKVFILGIIINLIYSEHLYIKSIISILLKLDFYSILLIINIIGLFIIIKKIKFNIQFNIRYE